MSTNPHRIVSVADRERFIESLQPSGEPADEIDMSVVENPPGRRPNRETARVLRILDELNREGSTE